MGALAADPTSVPLGHCNDSVYTTLVDYPWIRPSAAKISGVSRARIEALGRKATFSVDIQATFNMLGSALDALAAAKLFVACCLVAQTVSAAPTGSRSLRRNNDNSASSGSNRVSNAFKSLVVFGDSFSDDGHGAWLASNGTWPADPAYYGHHFSNGPTWAQVVAYPANLDLTLLDYAAGGATANNNGIAGFTGPNSTIPVPASQDQIDLHLKLFQPQSNDIFALYIGANDAFFSTNVTGNDTASLIEQQVQQLVQNGAENILLASYPDLNILPFATTAGAVYDDFLLSYSEELRAGLAGIVDSYANTNVNIQVVDVHSLFQDIVKRPSKYGFDSKVLMQSCLKGAYASEGVPRSLCSNPDSYVFWDAYHPTRKAHKLVAGLFIDAVQKWSQGTFRVQS